MTLALVFRARICWERPLKLPGLLSSCWMLTSSPISLIKTCKHRRQNVFSEAGHHSFERVIGRHKTQERKDTLPCELLLTPVWQTELGCGTQPLSVPQQIIFPARPSSPEFLERGSSESNWVAIVKVRTEEKKKVHILLMAFTAYLWPLTMCPRLNLLSRRSEQ